MPAHPTDNFLALQDALLVLLEQVRELHRHLAAHPDPGGAAEQQLQEHLQRRDALAHEIGHALLRLLAQGVRVTPGPIPHAHTDDAEPPAPATSHGPRGAEDPDPASPEPPADPAPPASLVALAQHGITPAWTERRTVAQRRAGLVALASEVGAPQPVSTQEDAQAQVHRLVHAVARMDAWLDHPVADQQALLGLVSSLARHVQDECGIDLPPFERDELDRTFSRMTGWSKEHRPGFVPGLSRNNEPDGDSWLHDAEAWWSRVAGRAPRIDAPERTPQEALSRLRIALDDEIADDEILAGLVQEAVDAGVAQSDDRLIRLLAPHQDRLRGAPGLKTLKTQLRDAIRDEIDDVSPSEEPSVPDDWPLRAFTSGKRAVIVGGDPRPHATARIQEAFDFAEVAWEENDPRRILGLADRIRGGTVDLVIALRAFLSHRDSDALRPACKNAGVPYCLVDSGYGVAQVRLAIERFCSDLVDGEAGDVATS